jgi:hypothetical protein
VVKHRHWNQVGELRGQRLTRRAASVEATIEFVDEQGAIVLTQHKRDLWNNDQHFQLAHKRDLWQGDSDRPLAIWGGEVLVDAETGQVLIPEIRPRHAVADILRLTSRGRINLGDGSWIELINRPGGPRGGRWQTVIISNRAGRQLLALRWRELMTLGEAVILPGNPPSVPEVLLAAFAFIVFEDWSTGGGGE